MRASFLQRTRKNRRCRRPPSGSSRLHHQLELSLPSEETEDAAKPRGFSRCGGPRLGHFLATHQRARRVWCLGRKAARYSRNPAPKLTSKPGPLLRLQKQLFSRDKLRSLL